MRSQQHSHVICLGDVKQAALYFDKVIPLNINQLQEHSNPAQLTRDLIEDFGSSNTSINEAFLGKLEEISGSLTELQTITKNLLPLKRNNNDIYTKKISELSLNKRVAINKFVDCFVSTIDNKSTEMFTKELINILLGFAYMEGVETDRGVKISTIVDQLSALTNSKPLSVLLPEKCLLNDEGSNGDISLLFPSLNLIDTSDTSWEKILEFRNDTDASKKLRNLRLFFEDNYKEKDRQYIEDDLMKRIDDYEQTSKEWRFQTITSTIGLILDFKNIHIVTGAALLGIFGHHYDQPLITNSAILAGTTIEIGKISLHVANCLHTFKCKKSRNDIAYIIEGKKRLE